MKKLYISTLSAGALILVLNSSYAATGSSLSKNSLQNMAQSVCLIQTKKTEIKETKPGIYQLNINKKNILKILTFSNQPFGGYSKYTAASSIKKDWNNNAINPDNNTNAVFIIFNQPAAVSLLKTNVKDSNINFVFKITKGKLNPLPFCGNVPGMQNVKACNQLYSTTVIAPCSELGINHKGR